jgi:hypothetical protein
MKHRITLMVATGALSIALVGCNVGPTGSVRPDGSTIRGSAVAGPVCPVETIPPDPGCAARPVAGAVLIVREATGREIARVTTDVDGAFAVSVPAGEYVLEPLSVEGLLGTPSIQAVVVGPGATVEIDLEYDTGIRGPVVAP